MSVSFFFRCFIYTLLVSIMVYGGKLRKIGIFAWRIGLVYSIFDLILVFFISEPWENRTFTFLLLLQCILVMPLVSPLNTCDFCGHRMYWHTIFLVNVHIVVKKYTKIHWRIFSVTLSLSFVFILY